jgi:hypothetical protein
MHGAARAEVVLTPEEPWGGGAEDVPTLEMAWGGSADADISAMGQRRTISACRGSIGVDPSAVLLLAGADWPPTRVAAGARRGRPRDPLRRPVATGASGQSFGGAQNQGFDRSSAREGKRDVHLLKPDQGLDRRSCWRCSYSAIKGGHW